MDKTNFPRLVASAKNPQLVSKLEEFCKQNKCSISQGIDQLLEKALGLTSLDNTADVPSASTSNSVNDTAQTSIKAKVNQLERKVDDLRSAVNELRVSPSAMPSANTANNVTKSVELVDGTLANTADSIDNILAKLEEIQRYLIRELKDLEDRIIIQQSERNLENFNHTHDWCLVFFITGCITLTG